MKATTDRILLSIARAGVELSWLYAWAIFITTATLKRSFPLPEAVGTFLLAVLSTRIRWFSGGLRRFTMALVLRLSCFSLAAAAIVYDFTDGVYPFFDRRWLPLFLNQPREPLEWIVLSLIGCLIVVFWVSGGTFARRADTYAAASHRFDLGVSAFLVLFLFKLILVYRGGIHIREPFGEALIFPFFIFSLLALGLINQRTGVPKSFLSGFQGVGLILGFAVLVLSFGAAAFLLFLPYLTMAAEAGYTAMQTVAGPLGPIIVSFLRFIFSPRRLREDPVARSSSPEGPSPAEISEVGGWAAFFQDVIAWMLVIVVSILVVILICVGMWYGLRWLLLKMKRIPDPAERFPSLRQVLNWIWLRLCLWLRILRGLTKAHTTAVHLFGALVRWGDHGGLPRRVSETPMEYGLRLSRVFPVLHRDIAIIVEAYHSEVYREVRPGDRHFKAALTAWRRLRSPRHWPGRLKAYIIGQRDHG